jgi:hypothetical protein
MRNMFDRLGKELGLAALEPLGGSNRTSTHLELNAPTLYADIRHEPDPARAAEREELGLLGRLASEDCLIEIYSRPPGFASFRSALTKHLVYWQQRIRAGRGARVRPSPPMLWILSAGSPRTILREFGCSPLRGWPAGVYRSPGQLMRVGFVLAPELPVDPSTLLVRLMAGGTGLHAALDELAKLDSEHHVRVLAEPILVNLADKLRRQKPPTNQEEQRFIMTVLTTWTQARIQGREEGRVEGRVQGQASTLCRLLTLKFGALPAGTEQHIAEASPEEVSRLLDRVLFADSLDAVFA